MILNRKRFGLILRTFAKTPDQVGKNVEQTVKAAKAAATLAYEGLRVFHLI